MVCTPGSECNANPLPAQTPTPEIRDPTEDLTNQDIGEILDEIANATKSRLTDGGNNEEEEEDGDGSVNRLRKRQDPTTTTTQTHTHSDVSTFSITWTSTQPETTTTTTSTSSSTISTSTVLETVTATGSPSGGVRVGGDAKVAAGVAGWVGLLYFVTMVYRIARFTR
ncbi:hypothetical protein ABW19_dt0200405 [Dactylella cylindrospora]|nr:hypothetical protein ABW19_dt0200405 [Dactylella cylindrospora]